MKLAGTNLLVGMLILTYGLLCMVKADSEFLQEGTAFIISHSWLGFALFVVGIVLATLSPAIMNRRRTK